ncbi:MAG: hypothetical protein JO142_02835 [Burkholderiales bacterium]|nr:hypothetical protein [Burkholderiales bacterium]
MFLFKPAALAAALVCSTFAQAAKPPVSPFDLMVQSGAKAAEMNSYNFSGRVWFDSLTLQTALPTRDKYPATDAGQQQYLAAMQLAAMAHQYSQLGIDVIKATRIDFNGAVDLQSLKVEISPTFIVSRHNLDSRITLPILLDGHDLSALVDISAVNWLIPDDSFKGINYIKAHLSPELSAKLDIPKLMAAMQRIRKEQYSAIDPASFSFSPMTASERKQGGVFKVHLRISEQEYAKLLARIVAELADATKDATPQDKQTDLTKLLSESTKARHTQEELDIVLDKQLQPIAIHGDIAMRSNEIQMHAQADIRIDHIGKPQFHLHPAASEIKDIGVFPPKPIVAPVKAGPMPKQMPKAIVPPPAPVTNPTPDQVPAPLVVVPPPPVTPTQQ